MNTDPYRSPNAFLVILIFLATLCFGIYFYQHPIRINSSSFSAIRFQTTPTQQSHATQSGQLAYVLYVVDGDTIDVDIGGKDTRVRLIGVNAPERYEGKDPQCFANEAGTYVKNRLEKKQVYLVSDPSQDDRDKYDRLLRYVFLENGTNFDLELIEQGFAKEYTYKIPYQYQEQFRSAQSMAKSGNMGLWKDCPD